MLALFNVSLSPGILEKLNYRVSMESPAEEAPYIYGRNVKFFIMNNDTVQIRDWLIFRESLLDRDSYFQNQSLFPLKKNFQTLRKCSQSLPMPMPMKKSSPGRIKQKLSQQ